jgi:hypothetical protein
MAPLRHGFIFVFACFLSSSFVFAQSGPIVESPLSPDPTQSVYLTDCDWCYGVSPFFFHLHEKRNANFSISHIAMNLRQLLIPKSFHNVTAIRSFKQSTRHVSVPAAGLMRESLPSRSSQVFAIMVIMQSRHYPREIPQGVEEEVLQVFHLQVISQADLVRL